MLLGVKVSVLVAVGSGVWLGSGVGLAPIVGREVGGGGIVSVGSGVLVGNGVALGSGVSEAVPVRVGDGVALWVVVGLTVGDTTCAMNVAVRVGG